MSTVRCLMLVASLATTVARAGAQSAAPTNSAYDQLPTTWEAAPEPTGVEPLPALEPPVTTLAYPEAAQQWTAPAPMPTLNAAATGYAGTGVAECDVCVNCGAGCALYGAYPPHSFWFGAVELTMLQPSYDNGVFGIDDDRGSVGPRLIFGWESQRGLGFRTRFWGLDNTSDVTSDFAGPPLGEMQLDAGRFDFDVYRRFSFDGSSIAVGASVTAGGLEIQVDGFGRPFRETGAGVGFLVEGRHEFYASPVVEWAVISRGRYAALVGEWRDPDSVGRTRGDANMEVLEAALGLEYKRKFRHCDFVLQYSIEAQSWNTTYVYDVNFLGSTASLGLNW